MSTGDQQPPEWNPYQQAGYHQDNPYQQPTAPIAQAGGFPPGTPGGPAGADKSHRTKMTLAIAASVLMVAGVTTGGVLLVSGSDSDEPVVSADGGPDEDDDEDEDRTLEPDNGEDEGEDGDEDEGDEKPRDPRDSGVVKPDPVVADDWQVQTRLDRGIAYDVPPDWELMSPDIDIYWEIEIDGENAGTMSVRGAGLSPEDACGYSAAVSGVTGERGATSTAAAADNSVFQYALGVYDNTQVGTLVTEDAEPFTSDHGLEGHIATGTIEDFPVDEEDECASPGGAVTVVSYTTASGDLASWLLIRDTGMDGEIEQDTVDKMVSSLRPYDGT